MSYTLVDTPETLERAEAQLRAAGRIALDCEAAGFHRYSDRLCLLQLSTPVSTFLLDPLSLELTDPLRPILEDPEVEVVMHGADYDLRLLDRDLKINVQGLFDTQTAATLIGVSAFGLASLLEDHLGVKLSKAHQRADWAQRPLSEGMLAYAADDTRHLLTLANILQSRLEEAGRVEWAREEFRLLEAIRWEEESSLDPILKVKGARDLSPREATALREALAWRDRIARQGDRAPFRVAGDQVLLAVVVERPVDLDALSQMKGISPRLARRNGRELLDRLERVDGLADSELVPYPRLRTNGSGRPTPEEETVSAAIRNLRTEKAAELKIGRGFLLSNAQIMEIVRWRPASPTELLKIPGIRRWQAGVIGTEILALLANGPRTR
jgi:ribonuclease D